MKEVKEILVKKIKQSLQPKSLRKTCKLLLFYGTLIGLFIYYYHFPKEPFSHTESIHISNGDEALLGEYTYGYFTFFMSLFLFVFVLYFLFFSLIARRRKLSYITDTFSLFHVIMIFFLGLFLFLKLEQFLNLLGISTYYKVERTAISQKDVNKYNLSGSRGESKKITDYDIEYPTTHYKKGYKRVTIWKGDWEKLEEGDSLLIYYYRGHFNGVTQVTLKKD
ncbi:hypothetical protein AAG747_25365 [Rapidithrix thailandica]|uniref:DUF3592 domain-containing protein n=1 Tax=Rapidithrix thailandica TaxID=413964 RepID=A0AAW9SCZ1_9BACT